MSEQDMRKCVCGGRVVQTGAVIGCRACGTVFAMLLSTATLVPQKYLPHPPPP